MKESRKTPTRGSFERDDCLDLLEDAQLARVVISVKCLPVALPARIALVERHHLLLASTDPGIQRAAQRNDVLSVQIDGLDDHAAMWSVMVSGIAALATTNEPLSLPLRDAVERGATLVLLPLSVVVGQHG
jgi:nitroimidazol reductase NimA-like FMN-containing flavoprotein (pyridoxamine 5'-phosphate oxidase superfamily)